MSTNRNSAHDDAIREAYEMYLKYHHKKGGRSEKSKSTEQLLGLSDHDSDPFPMFHHVQKTGVIFATARAKERGFHHDHPEWANMGQGAPETGHIEGAPSRNFEMKIFDDELEYAPNTGLPELREKVADYYNHLYRQGKQSQYTADNVCIVPGGRAGITRIMAALGNTTVGFFNPDYTAYEQSVGLFMRITPSGFLHRDPNEAIMTPDEFEFQTIGRGIGTVLLSNPANPTGQSIEGDNLKEYVRIARDHNVAIIMDEFYSHFYYDGTNVDPKDGGVDDNTNWPKIVSSAPYIEDVNKDPILIVNGLTKSWRCPGFRICWIVAPAPLVELLGNAGSFLDGGANAPLQSLALPLMDLDFTRRDTWALQRHFKQKRDFLLRELERLGISVKWKPTATFYVWADISNLPSPIDDSLVFLEECTKYKIICVPGVFFDINPRGTRHIEKSKCISNVRFSYGPPIRNLTIGMKSLEKMIQHHSDSSMPPDKRMRTSTYMNQTVIDKMLK